MPPSRERRTSHLINAMSLTHRTHGSVACLTGVQPHFVLDELVKTSSAFHIGRLFISGETLVTHAWVCAIVWLPFGCAQCWVARWVCDKVANGVRALHGPRVRRSLGTWARSKGAAIEPSAPWFPMASMRHEPRRERHPTRHPGVIVGYGPSSASPRSRSRAAPAGRRCTSLWNALVI